MGEILDSEGTKWNAPDCKFRGRHGFEYVQVEGGVDRWLAPCRRRREPVDPWDCRVCLYREENGCEESGHSGRTGKVVL